MDFREAAALLRICEHSERESIISQGRIVLGKRLMSAAHNHSFNTVSHTMGFNGWYPIPANPISFSEHRWISSFDRRGNWCQRGKAGPEVAWLSCRVRIQMLIFWIQISNHERETQSPFGFSETDSIVLCRILRLHAFLCADDSSTGNHYSFGNSSRIKICWAHKKHGFLPKLDSWCFAIAW